MGIFLELFAVFFQIGALAFGGGYAALPLIQRYVVEQNAWLSIAEFTDLVSLSQMTPGPIAINAATFVGTKVAGIPGAVVATLANVTPQFILMMTLGYFLFGGKKIGFLSKLLKGIRPAIVGLIAIATISMIRSSLWIGADLSWMGIVGFIVGLVLYGFKKMDLIKLIGLSALLGVVIHAGLMAFGG